MGKTVKTVMKIAAGAAIGVFAPQLAPMLLGALGTASATALATTVASAAIGAAAGEAIGIGWKAGTIAGGFGGAQSSGLFGGGTTASVGGVDAAANSPELAAQIAAEGGTSAAATSGASAASTGGTAGLDAFMQSPELAARSAAETGATTAGTTAGVTAPTLGATLGNVAAQAGRVGLDGLKLVAPQLAAAALVGNPGAALAKAQQEELSRAQQANASFTQARLDQANKLIDEAAYYDPEYMGRQAAEAAMIRGGIQTSEGTRGLTGERLAAERRRYNLGTARTSGTAYQQGYGTGVGARTQTRQAGIQSMPTAYPMASSSDAINASNEARRAREAQTDQLSALFSQALNKGNTTSSGT